MVGVGVGVLVEWEFYIRLLLPSVIKLGRPSYLEQAVLPIVVASIIVDNEQPSNSMSMFGLREHS